MFLTKKQESAIEFLITVLESRGLEVRYPDIETNHGKVSISEIRWQARNSDEEVAAHILLTKWDKKFKLIVWLPKNLDEGMSGIDPYVVVSDTHLVLPYGQGQLLLHKLPADVFMTKQEMRDYLGY